MHTEAMAAGVLLHEGDLAGRRRRRAVRVVKDRLVRQKIPVPTLVELREPFEASLLFKKVQVRLVDHDPPCPWIDGAQQHLPRTLLDHVPQELELQDVQGQE